jgi:hypothetical protein
VGLVIGIAVVLLVAAVTGRLVQTINRADRRLARTWRRDR